MLAWRVADNEIWQVREMAACCEPAGVCDTKQEGGDAHQAAAPPAAHQLSAQAVVCLLKIGLSCVLLGEHLRKRTSTCR
jgi:hypothetical protein